MYLSLARLRRTPSFCQVTMGSGMAFLVLHANRAVVPSNAVVFLGCFLNLDSTAKVQQKTNKFISFIFHKHLKI